LKLAVVPDPRELKITALQTEVNYLRSEVEGKYHFEDLVGRSAAIKEVRTLMEKAIASGLDVLITGETGVGKELVAKGIHYNSSRKDKPIIELNCGAVPKDLFASELFGHQKGTFTGANEDKMGRFEAAEGGTLILDEIGEMPLDVQPNLLRVLEEREFHRLGDYTSRDMDMRLIAMTNRNLRKEMEAGRFREDLYFRLSVFPIHVPPLRERLDDIPLLAEYFLQRACHQQNKALDVFDTISATQSKGFAPDVIDMLMGYPWPGNVRELENEIKKAVALVEDGTQIQTYHFSFHITDGESLIQEILSERVGLSAAVKNLQRRLIENALREYDGNRTQAARALGIHRPSLIRLMKSLGVNEKET